jgi:hypothetical protein
MARTKQDIQSEADKFDDPISWFRELAAAEGKAAPRVGDTEEEKWREYDRKIGLRTLIAE